VGETPWRFKSSHPHSRSRRLLGLTRGPNAEHRQRRSLLAADRGHMSKPHGPRRGVVVALVQVGAVTQDVVVRKRAQKSPWRPDDLRPSRTDCVRTAIEIGAIFEEKRRSRRRRLRRRRFLSALLALRLVLHLARRVAFLDPVAATVAGAETRIRRCTARHRHQRADKCCQCDLPPHDRHLLTTDRRFVSVRRSRLGRSSWHRTLRAAREHQFEDPLLPMSAGRAVRKIRRDGAQPEDGCRTEC
jgi:hypothetical protein